ncbi:MAG TPA: LCCL domain-containing protein [Beijerinckiaceae bacterium]|nr:LCCL domain-containing protein [Beijerinckiaceae bacterium]
MRVVQELVAYFDTRGQLSKRRLRTLLDKSRIAADGPTNMHGLCETVGATFYFRITGVAEGQVWGTDTYTRDSILGAAAVHSGLLKVGETAVLRVKVVPPPDSYLGTTRNGVTTSDYGTFPHAWTLSAI